MIVREDWRRVVALCASVCVYSGEMKPSVAYQMLPFAEEF